MKLAQIRDLATVQWLETGRKPFLNYCINGTNNTEIDEINLKNLFSPLIFNFTFSVVCSADETMKNAGFRNKEVINTFMNNFLKDGYNVRMFDPAGQDDIGGGCGQLWYVQQWYKNKKG